jgi:hypothetical protein
LEARAQTDESGLAAALDLGLGRSRSVRTRAQGRVAAGIHVLKAAIVSTVDYCTRFAYLTIALALLIGGFATIPAITLRSTPTLPKCSPKTLHGANGRLNSTAVTGFRRRKRHRAGVRRPASGGWESGGAARPGGGGARGEAEGAPATPDRGRHRQAHRGRDRGDTLLNELRAGFESGALKPSAVKTWPLDDAVKAYEAVAAGDISAKHILNPKRA